jgi:hypothetical protein
VTAGIMRLSLIVQRRKPPDCYKGVLWFLVYNKLRSSHVYESQSTVGLGANLHISSIKSVNPRFFEAADIFLMV